LDDPQQLAAYVDTADTKAQKYIHSKKFEKATELLDKAIDELTKLKKTDYSSLFKLYFTRSQAYSDAGKQKKALESLK
jgi:tetratricopeptide (TPR) repeat protein